MADERREAYKRLDIDERVLSVIVFSLFFSWILAFPFEGQIFYSLADQFNVYADSVAFCVIAIHFAGLFSAGFLIKSMKAARHFTLFAIAFCMAATSVFFFEFSALWYIALLSASFVAGICVASWGYFLRGCTHKNQRIKTVADGLIYSNILMIGMNVAVNYFSARIALVISLIVLLAAFLFALLLPQKEEMIASASYDGMANYSTNAAKPLAFLCLFIVIITIDSGLMYQVVNPAFPGLEWLTSWYWAVPYIAAIYIMRNLPKKANRAYMLYVGIAMIGFSFIAFDLFDRSAISYLTIDTLMLGACGIYDLFWWSILGEMVDLDENAAKILGAGLSANVMGVLLGGILGNALITINTWHISSSLLALGIVCITLVLLPPLHKYLSETLSYHVYLNNVYSTPQEEIDRAIKKFIEHSYLTKRESEIVALLLEGKTYRMIAGELHLSENTVKTHIKNIYAKYDVQSRLELMNIILEQQPRDHA